MGHLDELNQISDDLESKNATTNNDNEFIKIGSNRNSISLETTSSATSSVISLEDLQLLDNDHLPTKHDENQNENLSDPVTVPSHANKIFTGPGNWSMASNESLFSIRMGGASFCHLDSFSPLFELPHDGKTLETDEENNKESNNLNEPVYEDDNGNRFSATSSSSCSSSNSVVLPILTGERENGDRPYPHGALIGPMPLSPPQPEPAPEPRSQAKASEAEAEAEAKETSTVIAWTVWFPCFRYCA